VEDEFGAKNHEYYKTLYRVESNFESECTPNPNPQQEAFEFQEAKINKETEKIRN